MVDIEKITYVAFNSLNPFPIRMIHSKRAMHLEQVKVRNKHCLLSYKYTVLMLVMFLMMWKITLTLKLTHVMS